MKILIKIDENNRVTNWFFKPELLDDKTGWIEIDDYESPKQVEGKSAIEYYRDGKIVVEYKDLPPTPEEELEKIKKEYDQKIEMLEMAIMDVADIALVGGM